MNKEEIKLDKYGEYWYCKEHRHLWINIEDAICCCTSNWCRAMIPVSELKKNQHFLPASISGFVFVWLPTNAD